MTNIKRAHPARCPRRGAGYPTVCYGNAGQILCPWCGISRSPHRQRRR